jgi:hypothetical protein
MLVKARCPQAKSKRLFIKLNNKIKICFTTIPHQWNIGKVLLLYFKPIQKKVNFIFEILKCRLTHLRTMLGYAL